MSDYSEYFLGGRIDTRAYELIEITHPDFTKPNRIVRNSDYAQALTVDLSPSEQDVEFVYYPAAIQQLGARDDLDTGIRMDLGDVGTIVPDEMDAVAEAGGYTEKPALRYWLYRSDNLTSPMYGPLHLEIPTFAFNSEGASFEARPPTLNSTKTGERLTTDRIPMQKGFT